ncbi:hypothetical protein [Teichococcus aestuarii]|uniref:hypothetical protein n=1 Tax=Teichococcus aestuarii TaxID=568898 RepID=UPI00360E2DE7
MRLWRRGTAPLEAPVLFETAPESMGLWGAVDREGGAERIVFLEKTGFYDTIVHLGDRTGPTARIPLPSDASFTGRPAGWRRSRAHPGPSPARRTRRTRCWPSTSPPCCAANFSRSCCSSRRRAGRCRVSSGARAGWCSRCWTIWRRSTPCSPRGVGRPPKFPACRASAWSISGRWTASRRNPTAPCSPWRRTR